MRVSARGFAEASSHRSCRPLLAYRSRRSIYLLPMHFANRRPLPVCSIVRWRSGKRRAPDAREERRQEQNTHREDVSRAIRYRENQREKEKRVTRLRTTVVVSASSLTILGVPTSSSTSSPRPIGRRCVRKKRVGGT